MRFAASATSLSWIPSEAVRGPLRLPMDFGVGLHYDTPPPDVLDDLESLRRASRFRFANQLRAWIEVDEDGRISDYDQDGRGHMGTTVLRFLGREVPIPNVGFPDLRKGPEVGDGWVRFTQTTGGRTGLPYPRAVAKAPYVQFVSPIVWTTLELTIHTDGRVESRMTGASPFPRHWLYDSDGRLVGKSGTAQFRAWAREAFGPHSPWGDEDTPALVAAAESAAERTLSTAIMQGGAKPAFRRIAPGETLVTEGQPGTEIYLVVDGMFAVSVGGKTVAEIGPGAVVGERALLEDGRRTATVRALTPANVAVANAADLDPDILAGVALVHHREDA